MPVKIYQALPYSVDFEIHRERQYLVNVVLFLMQDM